MKNCSIQKRQNPQNTSFLLSLVEIPRDNKGPGGGGMFISLTTLDTYFTGPLIGPAAYQCIYIYIEIYAVESKLGPKIAFFWVKTWSNFSLFLVFLFFKYLLCKENEIFTKQMNFESKLGPILLRNILGPSFDSTLDQVLTQPFRHFGAISSFDTRCWNHYSYGKLNFSSPPQKTKEHDLWTQLR